MKKKIFPRTTALIDALTNQANGEDVSPQTFADMLEMNEESMGEGAAMMATCQAFDLTWEEGHELLAEAHDKEEE